jgi:hypothetical protein
MGYEKRVMSDETAHHLHVSLDLVYGPRELNQDLRGQAKERVEQQVTSAETRTI